MGLIENLLILYSFGYTSLKPPDATGLSGFVQNNQ